MGLAIINELYNELRRLSIAGSESAKDDYRLQKLIPTIDTLQKNSKVFEIIYSKLQKLLKTSNSSQDLLDLSKLVYAVMVTQYDVLKKYKTEEIETICSYTTTNISYRNINPFIEALTKTGSGRLEIIKNAKLNKYYKDVRAIEPLIKSLDETNTEIYQEILDIFKLFGEEIVAVLEKDFDINGNKSHARRLEIISFYKKEKYNDFYLNCFTNGSLEVQIASLYSLSFDKSNEDFLIKQTKSTNKNLRTAAIDSLSKLNTTKSIDVFLKILQTKNYDQVINYLLLNTSDYLTNELVRIGNYHLDNLLNKQDIEISYNTIRNVLDCLQNKTDNKIIDFLKKILDNFHLIEKIRTASYEISSTCLRLLSEINQKDIHIYIESLFENKMGSYCYYAFKSSLTIRSKEELYNIYNKYFLNNSNKYYSEIVNTIKYLLSFEDKYKFRIIYNSYYDKMHFVLDERWIKHFINDDKLEIVCMQAKPNDFDSINYMIEKLDNFSKITNKNRDFLSYLIFGLVQSEYSNIGDLLSKFITLQHSKGTLSSNLYYISGPLIQALPYIDSNNINIILDSLSKLNDKSSKKLYEMIEEYYSNK